MPIRGTHRASAVIVSKSCHRRRCGDVAAHLLPSVAVAQLKDFMAANGFENKRRNDYENVNLGLILEDLHDENVLTADGMLHFIDTVFFIKPDKFWD